MKHKKKSKRYGVGGSSNPLKDLNDMQALKRGQAYGSMLEGGGIAYKNGGANGPGDPPKNKPVTGQSLQKDGYVEMFSAIANAFKKGLKQFKNFSNSDANPTRPTESPFRKLYSQNKNKTLKS
jgi:hypothetical protein